MLGMWEATVPSKELLCPFLTPVWKTYLQSLTKSCSQKYGSP